MPHVRRGYLFLGEINVTGPGGIPTGNGITAGSGDWVAAGGDPNAYWPTMQAEYIGVLGVQAFIWNHIGTGSPAVPVPRLELFQGSILAIQENSATDPANGGVYPSDWNGPEYSFLIKAMGDPGRYFFNADSLSPTFVLNGGGTLGTMAPGEQVLGAVSAITGAGTPNIVVTLTHAHGMTPGSSDFVWLYGFNPAGGTAPDPQLTARHVATAHASDPNKLLITLGANWTGGAGILPSGIAVRARYRITALSNPSGSTLRIRLSDGLPSFWSPVAFAKLFVGNVQGVSGIDGGYLHTQKAMAYVKAINASTAVQAVAPGTLNLTAGTWTVQPLVGEVISIAGGTNAGKRIRVTSSTTTQIVGTAVDGSAALVNEAAGPSITLTNYAVLDVTYGTVPSLAGYVAGSGFVFVRSPWHPVFWSECAGAFDLPRVIDTWANVEAGAAAYFASYPGGVFAGDTVAVDGVMLGGLGYSDTDAVPGSAKYQAISTGWRQAMRELIDGIRARVAPLTSSGQAAEDVDVVVADFGVDNEGHPSNPLLFKGGDYRQTTAAIQFQTRAAAADAGAALVETQDLGHDIGSRVLSARGTWNLGERLWSALDGLKSAGALSGSERVANVVFLVGQSHVEGAINNLVTQPFQEAGNPDFDSSWYDTGLTTVLRPRQCYILDRAAGAFEEYAPVKNAVKHSARFGSVWPGRLGNVSGGPGAGNVGPEASLVVELRQRFENVYLVKVGVGGAALQDVDPGQIPTFAPGSADLSADIIEAWDQVRTWCAAHGIVPDVRGIIFDQGEGDAVGSFPAGYQAAQEAWINWMRDLVRTRGRSAPEIPVVLATVQTHDRMIFDRGACETINAGKAAAAASLSRVAIASMQGLPKNAGAVHDTWEACIARGRRYDVALGSIVDDDSGQQVDGGASINPALSPITDEDWSGETVLSTTSSGAGASTSSGSAGSATVESLGGASATAVGDPVELPADALGRARALVELIDQAMANGLEVVSYSVNGRTASLRGPAELLQARTYYLRVAARLSGSSRTLATF